MNNLKVSAAEVTAMRARIAVTNKAVKEALANLDLEAARIGSYNVRLYERWIECYA